MSGQLEAALGYVQRGWPVFPVRRDKRPRTAHGLKDATTDADQVRQWWALWPDAGVAIRTGQGLLVLDVDGDEGGESLHQLEREHGDLPETVRCVTGAGTHYYFRGSARNSVGVLGPGLDVRGDGGYVIAPPSPHPNGRRYEWDLPPDEVELAQAPGWLLVYADNRHNGPAPEVGIEIPQHERNNTLTSLGGSMRRRGMDEAEIHVALGKVNERRCRPPLEDREVQQIARSVARYEPKEDSAISLATTSEQGGRHLRLTSAGEIRSERVNWLWPDRIPLRGLTVVAGEKGLGKSILTNAHLAAEVTRGKLEGELQGTPADVLIATAEDSWPAVIKPRLMAHGADLDRVHRVEVRDDEGQSLLTLPDDAALFEEEIERLRANGRTVGMLVVDPIGAFLSTTIDSHKDAHVRRALAPLADLAERLDIAVLVVAHLTKDEGRRMIARVHGAAAFVNAARSVLALAKHPDDAEGEAGRRRVLAHVATNWGAFAPSLAAHVETREIEVDDGSTTAVGYLELDGETTVGVDELQRDSDEDGSDRREAIIAALKDGPRPSRDVKAEVAKELGCARKTVERAAMEMVAEGELEVARSGFPSTSTWELTQPDPTGDGPTGDNMTLTERPHWGNGSTMGNPGSDDPSGDRGRVSPEDAPSVPNDADQQRREAWKRRHRE